MDLIVFDWEKMQEAQMRKPQVSIAKSGLIGFNKSSITKFDMQKYQSVVLSFSPTEEKIYLELAHETENKIKLRKRAGVIEIGAKHFFSYFNILPKELTFFQPEMGTKENIIIIELQKGKTRQQIKTDKNSLNN